VRCRAADFHRRELTVPILAAVILSALAGCATGSGGSELQADLDALQQQVWKLEKDNAALSQKLAGAASAPTTPDAAQAEIRARLDSLQHDLQALKTRSDETDQRLAAMNETLRATRQALEALAASRAVLEGAPVPPAAAPLAQAPPPAPAAQGAAGVELYRLGYGDYAKGNYDQALAELQEFVRNNPQDDLADDAQYLIGEVNFSQQKYQDAVAAYDRLIADYPAGDKAAAAYLKKGLALLEMNRTADAVIQLQHVISAYPKSEEARLARERLRALGLRER
jgi:tol-pal system protein YbgF